MIDYIQNVNPVICCKLSTANNIRLIVFSFAIVLLAESLYAKTIDTEELQIVDCVLMDTQTIDDLPLISQVTIEKCNQVKGTYIKNPQADFSKAIDFWQPLAEKGLPQAQYNLAETYETALGESADTSLAIQWYQKSARHGFIPAQLSLARMYEYGIGVEKNFLKAMHWYQLALGLGDANVDDDNVFDNKLSTLLQVNQSSDVSSSQTVQALDQVNQLLEKTEQDLESSKFELDKINQKNTDLNSQIKSLSTPVKRNSILIKKTTVAIPGLSQTRTNKEYANEQTSFDHPDTQMPMQNADDETGFLPVPHENIAQLQQELAENKHILAKAEIRSKELANQVNLLEKKKTDLALTLDKLIPEDGPQIAVRWPEHEIVSGVYTSQALAGSTVNVIGAVYPHQLISEFSINNEIQELDENGLFLKQVTVENEPVTLELRVADPTGHSNTKLLVIKPNTNTQQSQAGSSPQPLPTIEFGHYYALVIGNSEYNEDLGWSKLITTINDANAVSKSLSGKFQFEVTTLLNADHDAILQALEKIRRKLTEHDNLLIYYAGHGYIDPENDQGYWIPIDGSTDSTINWISNSTISDQIRAMSARNIMVIADSCYSSSLMRSGLVNLRSGLSKEKRRQSLINDIQTVTRVVLSAGGLQPVADSINNSKHSVFAEAFLSVLDQSDTLIDSDALATQVGLIVATATQASVRQIPRYAPLARAGHLGGEFYFVPKNWEFSAE